MKLSSLEGMSIFYPTGYAHVNRSIGKLPKELKRDPAQFQKPR